MKGDAEQPKGETGSSRRSMVMKNCSLCHSVRIHQSRRVGFLEKTILAVIFVRPFRCERC